jgi:hypothetical protein
VPSTYARDRPLYLGSVSNPVNVPDPWAVRDPQCVRTKIARLLGLLQSGAPALNPHAFVQRPLARQEVMLSSRVVAYYGLIRASGTAARQNLAFVTPEDTAQGGRPEVPQFTPPGCTAMPPPLPRWPADCARLSLHPRRWPSPRVYGLGIHIRLFRGCRVRVRLRPGRLLAPL